MKSFQRSQALFRQPKPASAGYPVKAINAWDKTKLRPQGRIKNVLTSLKWRKLARRLKINCGYVCEMCGTYNHKLVVDHIHEIRDGGEIWERSNLQVLCYSCHARKTQKALQQRLATPAG